MGSGGHASLIGRTFAGYEVQALLGRGAMSCVYQAQDVRLGRKVALKVLLGSLARNPVNVRLFHREAQAAAPLRHTNIVRVYSAGVEAHTPYIAMEYVPGESLARFLHRKGAQKWTTALYIGEQVAAALECAHANGIVHRDVKPANILLDQKGCVRLTDFGIACAQHQENESVNAVMGTPHYMAPELCSGSDASASSDLYALGVTLYEMIAGELPFRSDSPVVLIKQIANEEAVRLNRKQREVPDDVARLVAHLLSKDPSDRPDSASVVRERIAKLMMDGGGRSAIPDALAAYVKEHARETHLRVLTPPPKSPRRSQESAKRLRTPTEFPKSEGLGRLAAIGCGILLCLLTGLWFGSAGDAEASLQPSPAITSARFDPMDGNTVIMRTPIESFRFVDVRWTGDGSLAVASAHGRPGTLYAGFVGAMSIDPVTRVCTNLVAPESPDRKTPRAGSGLSPMPALPEASALSHAMPVFEHKRSDVGSMLVARRLRVEDGALLREPLFTLSDFEAEHIPHVAPHPGGEKVCVALYDSLHNGFYLIEMPVPFEGAPSDGTRLTTADARLDPESIVYSPDGGYIAYLVSRSAQNHELWTVETGGGSVNGVPIAFGITERRFSISQDGSAILVSRISDEDRLPHAFIVANTDGTALHDLGVGRAGHEAWHPSESFVVVTAPDSRGTDQAWAVETTAPYRRRQLTTLVGGIDGLPAVSRDGTWAAAIENAERASMVFVDVSNVQFGGENDA